MVSENPTTSKLNGYLASWKSANPIKTSNKMDENNL